MAQWARQNVPLVIQQGRGKRETDRFINHWQAESGRNATKIDWVAAWRNWMLRAEDGLSGGRPANGNKPPSVNPRDEWKFNRS